MNLINGRVIFPTQAAIKNVSVVVEGGKIKDHIADGTIGSGGSTLDLDGCFLSPGFVDLQVNGGAGVDFMDCSPEEIEKVAEFFLRHGVTSFLGTVISGTTELMARAVSRLAGVNIKNLLGVHLEGPFLSQARAGAHNPTYLTNPKKEIFDKITSGNEEEVKLVTYAPELEGSKRLLGWIREINAIPSLGHTNACYSEVKATLADGVGCFTHLFNAMKGFHHRQPGPVGAALDSVAVVGLIPHRTHLHPGTVKLVRRVKGENLMFLVSDAIAAAGMTDGTYSLGDRNITMKNGLAQLEDGTVAGSVLTLDNALSNYQEFTDASLAESARVVTSNPAELVAESDTIGTMEVGTRADLVVFDQDLDVKYTIVGGEIVYEANKR